LPRGEPQRWTLAFRDPVREAENYVVGGFLLTILTNAGMFLVTALR